MKNLVCQPLESFRDDIPFCFPDEYEVDDAPYGVGNNWGWSTDDNEYRFISQATHETYAAGGYIVDLPNTDQNATRLMLQQMKVLRIIPIPN
jgi:hypothetical protein